MSLYLQMLSAFWMTLIKLGCTGSEWLSLSCCKFPLWKHLFDLFVDDSQLWRCGGRMSNSDLPSPAQTPILFEKRHHLTALIVMVAHQCVTHHGVKETLTEHCSSCWLLWGRPFVCKLIHHCLICRSVEGKPCHHHPYHVRQSRPFQYSGVDFVGPLYIKPSVVSKEPKVWLCLYTCCVTRAVHLDLVPNLNALTQLQILHRQMRNSSQDSFQQWQDI